MLLFIDLLISFRASLMAQTVKNPLATQETQETRVGSLGQEDPMEEEMATHSSILDWRIPWTEEHGELWFIGLQRVGHNRSNLADMHAICLFL